MPLFAQAQRDAIVGATPSVDSVRGVDVSVDLEIGMTEVLASLEIVEQAFDVLKQSYLGTGSRELDIWADIVEVTKQ